MANVTFDISCLYPEGEEAINKAQQEGYTISPALDKHKVMFDVLSNFLQPDSTMSVATAIQRTMPLYPAVGDTRPHPVNDMILEFARQIPYDNPANLKLVAFVPAFGQRFNEDNSVEPPSFDRFYDRLGIYIADFFVDPDGIFEDDETDDPMTYVNTTAFFALLLRHGAPIRNDSKIIWEMDHVLTGEHGEKTPGVRNAWIMGVAQWIIHDVEQCFQCALVAESLISESATGKHKPRNRSCWSRLNLWNTSKMDSSAKDESSPIRRTKWQTWKEAFASLALDESLKPECRSLAKQAANLMTSQANQT